MKKLLTLIGLTTAIPLSANAAIVNMTSISYTGSGVEFFTDENTLIDGSGLSAAVTEGNISTVTHSTVNGSNAWVTDDPSPGGGDYFADAPTATISFEITFDGTYTLSDFANWAYGFGTVNDNNVSSVTIDYGVGNFGSSTGAIAIAEAASAGGSVVTSLGGITADRVRLNFTDNHFVPAGDGGDRVGLAEVRFVGTAAVPEPSSTALLGLGGLALMLRRKK